MIEWILLFLLFIAIVVLIWQYFRLRSTLEERALHLFEEWRSERLEREARERGELLCREWAIREEERIRKDAVEKSEAVIRGKVTEHLVPYFPEFPYDPKDARFLGTPVDLVIFRGLSAGDLEEVVFVEVKTGKSGALSPRERQVRDCVGRKEIRYEVLHVKGSPGRT